MSSGVSAGRRRRAALHLARVGGTADRARGGVSRGLAAAANRLGRRARRGDEPPARSPQLIAGGRERPSDDAARSCGARRRRAVRARRPYGHASCAPGARPGRAATRNSARQARLRAARPEIDCRVCLSPRRARCRFTRGGTGVWIRLGVLDRVASRFCSGLRPLCPPETLRR